MNTNRIFQHFSSLETERLVLRQLDVKTDAQVLFMELYQAPLVTKYDTTYIGSLYDMKLKMYLWEQMLASGRLIVWGLELKSTKKLIGILYCEFFSMGIAYLECKLSRHYWRQGFMTEAMKLIIEFLDLYNVKQIFAMVNPQNISALELNKKVGFVEVSLNEMYFSKDMHISELMSLEGLINTIKRLGERIFVLPKINPLAFNYFELANLAQQQGNFNLSKNYYAKSLTLQPDFIYAKSGLAWAILNTGNPTLPY